MDMQDKEMDELFRSKLEGFEMEPSDKVWPGIAGELDPPKRKIALMPFLSVAASIIVLVAAGLLFIPKKEIIKPGRHAVNGLTKTELPAKRVPSVSPVQQPAAGPVNVNHINNIAVAPTMKTTTGTVVKIVDTTAKPAANTQPAQQPMVATAPKQQPAKAVVPDNSTALIAKQAPEPVQAYTTQPQIAALPVKPIQTDTLPIKTRHGIHSFGELVNVLVAKVDKRKNKVIEFSADDDGESHVTGINLGIIRIKKKE
jgi:hypothetical protein